MEDSSNVESTQWAVCPSPDCDGVAVRFFATEVEARQYEQGKAFPDEQKDPATGTIDGDPRRTQQVLAVPDPNAASRRIGGNYRWPARGIR